MKHPKKETPKQQQKILKFLQSHLHSLTVLKVIIKIKLQNEPQALKEKEKYPT